MGTGEARSTWGVPGGDVSDFPIRALLLTVAQLLAVVALAPHLREWPPRRFLWALAIPSSMDDAAG